VEVITMGRVSVDLYPEQVGVTLDEVTSFSKTLGGSPTNVAVAASRLGRRAAVVTKVGDDPFGRYVRRALDRFGVDSSWVGTDPTLRTLLAFCEIHPPRLLPYLFYRASSSPDTQLHLEDLDLKTIAAAPLLWTTGTGLSAEPSRSTTLSILANHRPGRLTVHDLDDLPSEWARPQDSPPCNAKHSPMRRSPWATWTRSQSSPARLAQKRPLLRCSSPA